MASLVGKSCLQIQSPKKEQEQEKILSQPNTGPKESQYSLTPAACHHQPPSMFMLTAHSLLGPVVQQANLTGQKKEDNLSSPL